MVQRQEVAKHVQGDGPERGLRSKWGCGGWVGRQGGGLLGSGGREVERSRACQAIGMRQGKLGA